MKYFFIGIFCLLGPLQVHGASLSFVATPTTIGVSDTVNVTLQVSSDVSVNAFSGSVSYNPEFLKPVRVSDGGSIIPLWIQYPTIHEGKINFAGSIPIGFMGENGKILSIQFIASKVGMSPVTITDIHVLRNDGAGTPEQTTASSTNITILPHAVGGFVTPPDTTPPEPYTLYAFREPDGYNYAVFSTVDKGSGIDHYEVAEQRFNGPLKWTVARSPYILHDQYLTSDIYIKAVDHAGNERTSILNHKRLFRPYEIIYLVLIITLLTFLVVRYYRTT